MWGSWLSWVWVWVWVLCGRTAYLYPQNGFVHSPSTAVAFGARAEGQVALDGAMNTITLHSPEEALVLIPHLLGYTPSNHLVFLALESWGEDAGGTRSCLGPILSLDLTEREMDDEMGIALGRALSRSAIRQAVMVYYRADVGQVDEIPAERLAAFTSVVAFVEGALEPRYSTFLKSYVMGGRTWGELEEGVLTSWDVSELESRPVAAALVFSGSAPGGPPPSQEIVRRCDAERGAAVAAGKAWWREVEGGACGGRGSGSAFGIDDGAERAMARQACAEWDRLIARWLDPVEREILRGDAAACGRANVALSLVGVRDRVLHYGLNPGRMRLVDVSEAELSRGLAVGVESRPAVDHVESLIGLLQLCASYAGKDDPYALSCIGYLSWWYGQNSVAARYVRAALAADNSYPLAVLLGDSLVAMVVPAWLRQR
ncbi:MAG: DUF4192 family protein [Ancrocorticia sp.]